MMDPTQNEQTILSDQVPTPLAGPSQAALNLTSETEVSIIQLSQGQLIWRRFRKHKLAMMGIVVLALLGLMAIFAPIISPESFDNGWNYFAANFAPRWTYPGAADWKYVMGSDAQGHALLMWITYGARISLAVGLVSAFLTMVIAVIVGGVAGYFGGWIDAVMMRITDVFLTLPFLPLLILISAYLSGGSVTLIVVIFGVLSWPGAARLVRSYYLTFRAQEFTEAARAAGVSDARIIFRHILPNAMSPVIVQTSLLVAGFILAEAAIDFLGVGIRPPNVSWGLSLTLAQSAYGSGNWWWAVFPGLFLLLTVLSINFVGDGLRDALDVRARA
ncbi:MAG: ABC transporter permease [Chloroflexota bacterium]|nr:ABC transporter permease [Chloroflexota bacterium]